MTKLSAGGDKILYSGVSTTTDPPCPTDKCSVIYTRTEGVAIAVDAAGEAYVGGNGSGTVLPAAPGAIPKGPGGFVVKVRVDGSGLAFANFIGTGYEFLGGGSNDANTVNAVALDPAGNVYVAGSTFDALFPATGVPQTARSDRTGVEGFAAKFSADGTKLMRATSLGRAGFDSAQSLSADGKGGGWVAGSQAGSDALVRLDAAGALMAGSAASYPGSTVGRAVSADASSDSVHVAGSDRNRIFDRRLRCRDAAGFRPCRRCVW